MQVIYKNFAFCVLGSKSISKSAQKLESKNSDYGALPKIIGNKKIAPPTVPKSSFLKNLNCNASSREVGPSL